jgi:type II secretory pathway pseudopilin PulG
VATGVKQVKSIYGCQRQQGAVLLLLLTVMVVASSYLLLRKLNSRTAAIEQISQTVRTLEDAKEALQGFATANSRLPCPATPASAGVEKPSATGICTVTHGFIPAVTLGIAGAVNRDSLLLDAWGNPVRYSVTGSNSKAFTMGPIVPGLTPDLSVCKDAGCGTTLITNAVVVVYSMGKDGALQPVSTDQRENGETRLPAGETGPSGVRYWVSNDRQFVSHESNPVPGSEFDDLVKWISVGSL